MRTRIAKEDQVIGSVKVAHGSYRNKPIAGTFDLVQDYKPSTTGLGFVTIREDSGKRTRIRVDNTRNTFRIVLNATGKALKKAATSAEKRGRSMSAAFVPQGNSRVLESTL